MDTAHGNPLAEHAGAPAITDHHGFPVPDHIASARPQEVTIVEVTIVEATLARRFDGNSPQRLIGDQAYDSASLDGKLSVAGVALIAPHRCN